MTQSEIIWEAYKIIRDACENSETCGERCPLYETCKGCDTEPHKFIKNLHYDLFTKPIFDKLKFEDKPLEETK